MGQRPESHDVKRTDDYSAKYELWAREGRVYALPKIAGLPRFGSRKFTSHREMNDWKRSLLDEVARLGGVRWTR